MIWISTNGRPSNGAKELAKQPGFKRLLKGGLVQPGDIAVNWGSSQAVNWVTLNNHQAVARAANKLKTFACIAPHTTAHVRWTADKAEAQGWLIEGHTIVVRTKLTGHSGDGIIIVEPGQDLPDAPLYTRYVFKEKEFRVHVVHGQVIDTQRKIKDPEREVVSWKVRSHENGFIYVREKIMPDPVRDELAALVTNVLNLDFGAVDIIQDKKGLYYVLEVNTAPGITGQTVLSYAKAFRDGHQQG